MAAIDDAIADLQEKVGETIGVSNWICVDQPMIDQFAVATHDDHWIHIDPDRAKATPFGGTIAHGFLTLSLASRFAYDCFPVLPGQVMGINYGFERLRFVSPVRANSYVRGRFELTRVEKRATNRMLRQVSLTIEIQKSETPALVADWLGLIEFSDD